MNTRKDISLPVRLMAATLIALLVLLPGSSSLASPRAASTHQGAASDVEARLEGYIKAMGAGKWLIGSQSVLVNGATVLIEKRGKAEVGAWVIAWGTLSETGSLNAKMIYVDRPAGRSGPTRQFSGILTKQLPSIWIIDDMLIKITSQTQITGNPGTGWLVWVVAENDGDGFKGIAIEAIAETPKDLPVEFEGLIEAIEADKWRVDGYDVFVSTSTVILGTPTVNFIAEVKATRDAAGRLHAHMIRVLDPNRQTAIAVLATAEEEAGPGPSTTAEAATRPESQAIVIAKGFPDAASPTLVQGPDGVIHALWVTQGRIYYANQAPGQAWSTARRIATGSAPIIMADKTGQVHALFHNEFFGNYEVYHMIRKDGAWSLPINIARTEGVSLNPTLAIDGDGVLRAAWMDSTPGYWTIYTGYYDGTFWRNYPAPNARGEKPAIAAALDGTLYLAWQDRVPTPENATGVFAVFLNQYKNGAWSLPINISAHPELEATNVSIAVTNNSMAHLTWIAGERAIKYCYGRDLYWPAPQTVVQTSLAIHGPRIIAEHGKILHIAWDEWDIVRATMALPAPASWPKPEVIASSGGRLKDVALAGAMENGVMIGWADISLPNNAAVYASEQTLVLPVRAWLPLITLSAP